VPECQGYKCWWCCSTVRAWGVPEFLSFLEHYGDYFTAATTDAVSLLLLLLLPLLLLLVVLLLLPLQWEQATPLRLIQR
jgi:hypothetical protein